VPDVARRSAAVSVVMSKDPDLLPPQSLGVSGRPRSDNSDSDSVTQDREANVKQLQLIEPLNRVRYCHQ
jgi:hypothetical protein